MQDKDAEIKFPFPLELHLIIQAMYFKVKLDAKASKNILSNVMYVLSTCIESDKGVTKKLILSEQSDLNLLNRKPENTVLMEKVDSCQNQSDVEQCLNRSMDWWKPGLRHWNKIYWNRVFYKFLLVELYPPTLIL